MQTHLLVPCPKRWLSMKCNTSRVFGPPLLSLGNRWISSTLYVVHICISLLDDYVRALCDFQQISARRLVFPLLLFRSKYSQSATHSARLVFVKCVRVWAFRWSFMHNLRRIIWWYDSIVAGMAEPILCSAPAALCSSFCSVCKLLGIYGFFVACYM